MDGYVLISVDPGGQSDPTGYCAAIITKVEKLTKLRVIKLGTRRPIQTPSSIVALAEELVAAVKKRIGSGPVQFVIDCSNNSGVAHLLAQALPRDSMIAIKITAGDDHGAGVSPLPVGEVKGRSTALPCMTLSRRQMLLDLGAAFTQRQISLPLDDDDEREGLATLKSEMARASLKTTPSGRQIAVVNRGHDDLLLAVAQAWAIARRLPGPRDPKRHNLRPVPTSAAWT